MKVKANILLVEDDDNLSFILKDYLGLQNYYVDLRTNGVEGLEAFKNQCIQFDICVIDVMLPLKDGFSLARDIKKIDSNIPVIFLTAKNMKEDRITGLKIGADDYITKPFSSEELILRIDAILRRYKISTNETKKDIFQIGQYVFDIENQILIFKGHVQQLTKKEAKVLHLLCINKNQLVRRELALQSIWGGDDYFMGRSMDVYITRLRKYLQSDSNVTIINIHGTGFRLEIIEKN